MIQWKNTVFVVLIVIVPFIVVNLFVKEEEIKFNYTNNLNVRVKRDTGIVTVPLEDYVVGVLAGEMPIEFEMEALKAQAVAARSYVLKKWAIIKKKNMMLLILLWIKFTLIMII